MAEEKAKAKEEKSFNTAIVLDGTREVRRYTLQQHGKKFAELAKEFASKNKYQVEYKEEKEGIVCPVCGNVLSI